MMLSSSLSSENSCDEFWIKLYGFCLLLKLCMYSSMWTSMSCICSWEILGGGIFQYQRTWLVGRICTFLCWVTVTEDAVYVSIFYT